MYFGIDNGGYHEIKQCEIENSYRLKGPPIPPRITEMLQEVEFGFGRPVPYHAVD